MKLRIRAAAAGGGGGSASTLKLEVPAACSLQGLQDAIVEALESRGISVSCRLGVSLNKTEPIEGQGSALLSQFGIRSGDLLFYFERESPATAGLLQSDMASKDLASSRRELCAAAAARRASSVVQSSSIVADVEDTSVSASESASRMVDEISSDAAYTSMDMHHLPGSSWDVAHTSLDIQIDGEDMPSDMPIDDIGGARVSNSIPAILQRILIAEHRNVSRPSDLLVLAVHAVMLETGFVVMNAMEKGQTLPGGWSNGGIANICYSLPEIRHAENGVGNVVLKSLTLGGNVVVYGTIDSGTLAPMKLSMLTSKHIIGNVLSHDDLISSYADVFELWRCAKDELSLPLLTALCEIAGLPAPPSLLVIPTELKMKILECLPALDLVKAGCTCSELRHLSANDELWKKQFLEEFGNPSAAQQLPSFRGWKAAYAVRFLDRKRMLERRSRPPSSWFGMSSRFPRFPRMRGVIGGDYDIYPSFGGGPFRTGFGSPRGSLGGLHGRFRDENMGDDWYT